MAEADDQIFQILSLSGGGVRGLYSAKVLADLEHQLADEHNEPDYWIGCHFDLICGTSIGGIIALALASGMTARSIYEAIEENRSKIFPPHKSGLSKLIKQMRKSLYTADPLRQVLAEIYGDKTIGDLKTRAFVPAVNFTKGGVQIFKTPHHVNFKNDWKVSLVDAALTTSAAPTYFPIHKMDGSWYVDGGLAANSPALMAIHESTYFLNRDLSNLRMMQVGTMGLKKTADQRTKLERGYFQWKFGQDIIQLTLSSNEELHNVLAAQLIEPDRLLVLDDVQTPDNASYLDLDNASDQAADTLRGKGAITAQKAMSNPIYQQIVQHRAQAPTFYYGPNKNAEKALS